MCVRVRVRVRGPVHVLRGEEMELFNFFLKASWACRTEHRLLCPTFQTQKKGASARDPRTWERRLWLKSYLG